MKLINKLYQISHYLYIRKFYLLSRSIDLLIRVIFQASIPGQANIASSAYFHHGGLGVVINGLCVIEEHCEIHVHVVLGGGSRIPGAPYLERSVIVQAGAKVIGPVRIGTGSVIAANAVVIADVPPHCLVAGVPAIIKRTGIDSRSYRHTPSITT